MPALLSHAFLQDHSNGFRTFCMIFRSIQSSNDALVKIAGSCAQPCGLIWILQLAAYSQAIAAATKLRSRYEAMQPLVKTSMLAVVLYTTLAGTVEPWATSILSMATFSIRLWTLKGPHQR